MPEEKPLILDSEVVGYASKLPDTINVRLKESAVARQIATGLYKSPRAGFRELYSNECRAARTTRQKFNANSRIEVTLDPKKRALTIQGLNSLGITAEVFADVLRWMGRTSNNSEAEVGQFGWGFFALWTLADYVRLETYARETGERYGVTAKDAGAFTLLPERDLTIQEYGTKVQLQLKKQIDLADLADWIEENCRYSDIETWLTVSDKIEKASQWGYTHIEREPERKRLDGTFKQQVQRTAIDGDSSEQTRIIYDIEIDDRDFYFYGAIAGDDEHASLFTDEHDVLLLRVPIEAEETELLNFPFTAWVLNIKDERAYPPTPDRDRFVEGALSPILEKLQKAIGRKLKQLNIKSFDDYRHAAWKGIYANLRKSDQVDFIDEATWRLVELLSVNVACPRIKEGEEENKPEDRPYWRRRQRQEPYELKPLRTVVARSMHLFYYRTPKLPNGKPVMPAKRMATARAILRTKYPDAEVFTYSPSSLRGWYDDPRISEAAFLDRLSKTGEVTLNAQQELLNIKCELGKEWRRVCGLSEAPRKKPPPTDWPIHQRLQRGIVEPRRVKVDKIPSHVIRIPSNLKKYIAALTSVEAKRYGLTRDSRFLKGGQTLADFLKHRRNMTARTKANAHMTFEEIATAKGRVAIYVTCRPEVLDYYDVPEANVAVAVDEEKAFQLIVYLTANKKDHTIIRHPDAEAFVKKTGVDLDLFTGNYPSFDDSSRTTIAYLGACLIRTLELRELFLHSTKETYNPEEAEHSMELALSLESDITGRDAT
jgi:hypothetical protein